MAGQARGHRLSAPPGRATRPTSDRVRESVFNILSSLGGVDGRRVLDLFAGSGAMGIEALSRGASEAVLVERDATALAAIAMNLSSTGLGPARVVRREAMRWIESQTETFDLAFCDPPYDFGSWDRLLARLPVDLAVLESDRELGQFPGWNLVRSRRYGGTVVEVLERSGGGIGSRAGPVPDRAER